MAKLVLLFVCVAVFQLANALQCYHCEKEACEKDMKDWQKSQCAPVADPKTSIATCLKQVYKDKTSHKEVTSRKCAIASKNQKYTCNLPANTLGEEVACVTCESDLCNSANSITFSLVTFSAAFLALFVPKFLS